MGKHSGAPAAGPTGRSGAGGDTVAPPSRHSSGHFPVEPRPAGPGRRLATYVVASVATLAAWAVLVYYAIQLGPDAKSGELGAWLLLVVATLGAVACLFLCLVLGGRVLELLRGGEPAAPPPPPGGRRAKR